MSSSTLEFTRSQLAKVLGISRPTLNAVIDLGAPGVLKTGARGKAATIDGRLFIPWYLERERARVREEGYGKSLFSQQLALEVELKRLRLDREHKEHVPRGALLAVLREAVCRVNDVVAATADQQAESIVGIRDRIEATQRLKTLMDHLRQSLRDPELWAPPDTSSAAQQTHP